MNILSNRTFSVNVPAQWFTDTMVDVSNLAEDLEYECPRCSAAISARLYGPCRTCCETLRAEQAGEKRDLEAAEYVPKMNVTPNAVALKD